MLFHFLNHKYGKLDAKGIQYCEICGKARYVKIPCKHKWVEMYTTGNGYMFVWWTIKCTECGEIREGKT